MSLLIPQDSITHSDALQLYQYFGTDQKDLYNGYINFIIAMTASLLTAGGWYLTSEKAQDTIRLNKPIYKAILSATIASAVIELFILHLLWEKALEIQAIIDRYGDILMITHKADYRHIDITSMVAYYILHLMLYSGIIVLVIRIAHGTHHSTKTEKDMD